MKTNVSISAQGTMALEGVPSTGTCSSAKANSVKSNMVRMFAAAVLFVAPIAFMLIGMIAR